MREEVEFPWAEGEPDDQLEAEVAHTDIVEDIEDGQGVRVLVYPGHGPGITDSHVGVVRSPEINVGF